MPPASVILKPLVQGFEFESVTGVLRATMIVASMDTSTDAFLWIVRTLGNREVAPFFCLIVPKVNSISVR
jgi:hypothetical protein